MHTEKEKTLEQVTKPIDEKQFLFFYISSIQAEINNLQRSLSSQREYLERLKSSLPPRNEIEEVLNMIKAEKSELRA